MTDAEQTVGDLLNEHNRLTLGEQAGWLTTEI